MDLGPRGEGPEDGNGDETGRTSGRVIKGHPVFQGGEDMMTHGYSIIALDNPKSNINVGSAMRAVGVYGASALFVSGKRIKPKLTDPMKYYRHIP